MDTTSSPGSAAPGVVGPGIEIASHLPPAALESALRVVLSGPNQQRLTGKWTQLSGRVDDRAFTVRILKPVFGTGTNSPVSLFECVGAIEPVPGGGARLTGSVRPRTDGDWQGMSGMLAFSAGWSRVVWGIVGGALGWRILGLPGALLGAASMLALFQLLRRLAMNSTGRVERDAIAGALATIVSDAEAAPPDLERATRDGRPSP